jgi:hypothetical protein
MNKLFLLAAALTLPAVADAKPMGEKVTAEVVGIDDIRIGIGAAGFTVVTELTRKKAPPMILTGLRFDVLIDGQKIGEGSIEDTHRLKRNKAVRVEIPTQVMATAGLMAIMNSSNAELSIAGAVTGRWLFFKQERTFSQTISLQDVMDTVQ